MKLDVGSFTVNSVDFSDQTQLTNGKLELDNYSDFTKVLVQAYNATTKR